MAMDLNRSRNVGVFHLLSGAALVAAAGLTWAPAAMAQEKPAAKAPAKDDKGGNKQTDAEVVADFIHYVKIARYDLAQATGQDILTRGLSDREFAKLIDSGDRLERFESAVALAQRVRELEPTAAKLADLYTKGKLATARDPEQIAVNIKMLLSSERGRLIATERLRTAGEYAVPQLLTALLNPTDRLLGAAAQDVLVAMGPQAVMPLSAALLNLEPAAQERVANVLALVPYPQSTPFLADVAANSKNASVQEAAKRALAKLGASEGATAAVLYPALAEKYYREAREVTSFPGEEFQLLWDYQPQIGLVMTAVRTPVYHEAMAMRLAERSLALSSDSPLTAALWISSNLKREIETPKGYQNPAYPAGKRDAMYFAVAAGAEADQRVLARAIDTRNTPLALKAIAALAKTAGGNSLWGSGAERQPLVEAVTYPNRRVQFEAALVLGGSNPKEAFSGSERVVPAIASAVREAQVKIAVVVASDSETYQVQRGQLEKAGYSVLAFARTLGDVSGPIAEAPAVDAIVIAGLATEAAEEQLKTVRGTPKLVATPVMILGTTEQMPELRRRHEGDSSVAVRPSGSDPASRAKALEDLVLAASGGPISADESKRYAERAVASLRDLALSGNTVLKIEDAVLPLLTALNEIKGPMRIDVAEVLSRINQKQTQVALVEAALAASGGERVVLLGKTATSAKLFGNLLEARHVNRVIELAKGKDAEESVAAAGLLGSLSLTNKDLVPLILGKN